jgi:hypothetical protein
MTPSVSPGKALGRVQGLDSSLGDLTLHDGRKLALELGGSVQPTPTITRTIAGSSSITMGIRDDDLTFLDSALLAEKLEAQIDGLWFRYIGAELDPPLISLTFEDRDIARLREFKGPKKAYRAKTTRAEFVVSLIRKALPNIPVTCPQLHVKQPIKTEKQAKRAKTTATEERGKGLTDQTKGLKVKGVKASASQVELGDMALRIAESHNAPYIVMVALIAALIDENDMSGPNVLQAEPFTAEGASTPAADEISGFLVGKPKWTGETAIGYYKAHPSAKFYEIAQAVQASGAGEGSAGKANYGQFGTEAREWVDAFGGGEAEGGSTSTTVTEPYIFEVHKNEDYWTAIKRLAKEVNWRAFFSAHRFFFIDEIELFRGMVRLAIERDTPGVEKVGFRFGLNRPATEVTVTALANRWTPPPGSVVTIGGYGPASLGSGDAPVKANAKGQKQGVGGAQVAATGEGHGRYLVESIEAPLRDSDVSDLKLVTVKLFKPTAPLPEPAAKTKTKTETAGGPTGALSGEGYTNPFPDRAVRSRTDQGVDFTGSGKIVAIGNAEILSTGAPGWPEGGGVLYKLLDGPRAGQAIYVYEGVDATTSAHQKVSAGQQIASFRSGGSIEIGFADASGVPISHSEYHEGLVTKSGKEMSGFLTSIGAP